MQVLRVGVERFLLLPYVFGSIFDSKSNIYPRILAPNYKHCIHEKCGRASRIQKKMSKVLKMTPSLSKSTKTSQKMRNLCIAIYNRNSYSNPSPLGRGTSVHFGQKIRANFERTYLQGHLNLEARIETTLRHTSLFNFC